MNAVTRRARDRGLTVWMNGERVGTWRIHRNGEDSFEYVAEWLTSPNGRPISLSIPTLAPGHVERGPHVASFFDNLLPDRHEIREAMQQRYGAVSARPFDLLAEAGRDCVGAIQLLPEDAAPHDPRRIDAEPLDEAAVAAILRTATATSRFGAGRHGLRLSLAGAQDKTALLRYHGAWCLPRGSTPTTHILKLPMGQVGDVGADFSCSVEVEHLCARLLDALCMPVARTEIARFEDQRVLVVERFDRRWMDDGRWIARLPQEDFCQVLRTPPARKYETDGGPGMRDIDSWLQRSRAPQADRERFFQAQILFWLLAAIDGHAKNFSLFLEPRGAYRLTPFYDVLSAFPVMGAGPRRFDPRAIKMAMAPPGTKNRHFFRDEILPRHWRAAASALRLAFDVDAYVERLQVEMPRAMDATASGLGDDFPVAVRDAIFEGVAASLARWARLAG